MLGYTSVSNYSRYSLCSHSVRVAQKTATCGSKKLYQQKNISHRSYVVPKLCESQKICCGNRKNYFTPKSEAKYV